DPAVAAYLRQALLDGTPADRLSRKGLGRIERAVYAHVRAASEVPDAGPDRPVDPGGSARRTVQARVGRALAHAGARLSGLVEHGSELTVRYVVMGREHLARVRRDDLAVVSAGICLSGLDGNYDLASLVGVMEEADREGLSAVDPEDRER
ncbi:MAG: hypothetical protein HY815_22660, partial [Candidatus Riflebacteria bacterium]|nr:hypothetical protein [Candidatus Riflebacteria bacterium]